MEREKYIKKEKWGKKEVKSERHIEKLRRKKIKNRERAN
jgi:hypothetical protein